MIRPSHPLRTTLFALVGVAAILGLSACGDDDSAGGDCARAEGGRVELVAVDIEFEPGCLEIPAEQDVDIVLDNQDDGVQHNIHITDAPGGPTTELEAGPVTQTLAVNLPPGNYDFLCDLHPAMTGTITAGGPPGGPGNGGGGPGD